MDAQQANDFSARQERRKAAAALALQMGTDAQQGVSELQALRNKQASAMDAAGVEGKKNIRAQAAEGLAAAQAGGAYGGGAAYANTGDASQRAGLNQAEYGAGITKEKAAFESDIVGRIGDARTAATGQQLEAQKFMAEQGSLTEDRQAKQATIDSQIAGILKNNKGFFNDDEVTAAAQIRNLLANEDDEVLRAYIEKRAKAIRDKQEDF